MRIRHVVRVIAPLALLVAALAAPTPVAAAITLNLAGRPYGPSSDYYCHGLAYGRVNNELVLFTADHCWGDDLSGWGPTIGTWGPRNINGSGEWDLAYIRLNLSQHNPSVKNQIYRGPVTGNNYWTITAQPSPSLACDGRNWGNNYTVYHNYQMSDASLMYYRTGSTTQEVSLSPPPNTCVIYTTLSKHQGKDSGSPFVLSGNTNTLFAVATSTGPNNTVAIAPIYTGLLKLDQYWQNAGTHTGAYLCTTSTCGAQ
jgi:hypothetical protein